MPIGLLRPYQTESLVFQRLIDACLICLVLLVVHKLYGVDINEHSLISAILAVACFYLFAEAKGLYASWRMGGIVVEITDIAMVWGMVVAVLVMLAFMSKTSAEFSRLAVMTWFVATPFALVAARILVRVFFRILRRASVNVKTLAIVGANTRGLRLFEKSQAAPWTGLLPLGIYDDVVDESVPDEIRPYMKGTVADLIADAHCGKADYVYIVLPMQDGFRIQKLVSALADTTVSVYIVPDMFVSDLLHARWTNFHGIAAIMVYETPFTGADGWVKRAEDFLLGTLFLIVALIPMAIIGAAVRLTSPGSAIFKQNRYGLNGEVVEVWKFRTMLVSENDEDVPQARKSDPRITPLGKILRKTSLDELPQLINVLQGRMSLVGPRPHAVIHNEAYRKLIHGYMLRHKVKPGITGWAQVNGWRGETSTLDKMEKRIEYDLEYIRNWSLWLDLKILWLTVFRGIFAKNAY